MKKTSLLQDRTHPIIQAPMAGVSTPRLAAAVSNAGPLGAIGIGASTLAQAREMIGQTLELTAHPFIVNVFCHPPARRDAAREAAWIRHYASFFADYAATPPAGLQEIYPSFLGNTEALRMLIEQKPAVVSFHFGIPASQDIKALHDAGISTMATATNLHEAKAIEQAGIDFIVAQGSEAGGHRGMFDPQAPDELLPMATLVRLLVRASGLPVIAAGGIIDGAGIAAALALGAAAAQMGTAFILCPESAADESYRSGLRGERASRTRLTASISGRPARGMLNRFIAHGEASGHPLPADYPVAYDLAKQLHRAASVQGSFDCAAHWAGQGAPLARALPAGRLVELLVQEMRDALKM
jgi:nitronate monooxygenase